MKAAQRWTWKAVKGATGIQKGTGPAGQTAYRVRWFEGGTRAGRERTRTFDLLAQARAFRGRLVAGGYHDPDAVTVPRQRESDADTIPVAGAEVPTLRAAVESYLSSLDVAGRTIREYRSKADLHVYPVILKTAAGYSIPLGDMPIDQAAIPEIMIAWLDQMKAKTYTVGKKNPVTRHYSAKTITEIACSILSPTFEYAKAPRRRWIETNPCHDDEFKLPERKGRTVKLEHILTPTEFNLWIDAANDADHQLIRWGKAGTQCLSPHRECGIDHHTGDVVTFILATGMRWSEVTAIRWRDIDLDAGIVVLCRVVKEDANGKLFIDETEGKTGNAFRTMRFSPSVVAMLRRRKGRRPDTDHDTALVFGAPGRRPHAPFWRRSNFHTARWPKVEAAAVARDSAKDPSPHRLRHSHAVLAIIAMGIEMASKRLGHANVGITSSLYGHLVPEADVAAADAFEKAITPELALAA